MFFMCNNGFWLESMDITYITNVVKNICHRSGFAYKVGRSIYICKNKWVAQF